MRKTHHLNVYLYIYCISDLYTVYTLYTLFIYVRWERRRDTFWSKHSKKMCNKKVCLWHKRNKSNSVSDMFYGCVIYPITILLFNYEQHLSSFYTSIQQHFEIDNISHLVSTHIYVKRVRGMKLYTTQNMSSKKKRRRRSEKQPCRQLPKYIFFSLNNHESPLGHILS